MGLSIELVKSIEAGATWWGRDTSMAGEVASLGEAGLDWGSWPQLGNFDFGWGSWPRLAKAWFSHSRIPLCITPTPKEIQTPKMPLSSSENYFPSELRQQTHEKLLATHRQSGITAVQYAQCIKIFTGARPETQWEHRDQSHFRYNNQSKILKEKTKPMTPSRLREQIVISWDCVYQTVAQEHLKTQLRDSCPVEHCRQKSLWHALSQKYYEISRTDMTMILKDCQFALCKKNQIEHLHSTNRQPDIACSRCQLIDDNFIQELQELFNQPLLSKHQNSIYDVDHKSLFKILSKVRAARLHSDQQTSDIRCLIMQEVKLQLSQDVRLQKSILIVDSKDLFNESSEPIEFFENYIDFNKIDVQDSSWKHSQEVDVQWWCWDVKLKVKAIHKIFKELFINCFNLCSIKANSIFECLTSTQVQMLMNLDATVFSEKQTERDIISCKNHVVHQYLDHFYLFTAARDYSMIILPHQNSMSMNISFDVKEEKKIILVLANMSDEDWKKFGRKEVNYWNMDWIALKLTKEAKFLLNWQSHIVLSTMISIVHCFHFVFYSEVQWMIMAMLFEEDYPDTINDGGFRQRCLFARDIKSLLANKSADCFGGSTEIKECMQLLSMLEKKLQCHS